MDHPIESPICIVVGVDGSPCSKQAVGWAIHQAYLADATVEVIASWQDPTMSGYGFGWMPPVSGESQDWPVVTDTCRKKAVTEAVSHRGASAGRGQPRARHPRGDASGFGQSALRSARPRPVVVVFLGEAAAPASIVRNTPAFGRGDWYPTQAPLTVGLRP